MFSLLGHLQILAVFIVAAPIVYGGGLLYSLITGSTIQLGLLKIYSVSLHAAAACLAGCVSWELHYSPVPGDEGLEQAMLERALVSVGKGWQ